MTIRKLSAFAPLALMVGAVVHLTVAGLDHAPGGRFAFGLFGILASSLGAALAAAFLAGAFGRVRTSIATRRRNVYGTLALAAAGTATYALLELAEGHLQAGGLIRALAASLPVAALVRALATRVAGYAHRAGERFAAASHDARSRYAAGSIAAGRRRTPIHRDLVAGCRRGRAPPLFV